MKKLNYANFMNDEFRFISKEDEVECMQHWAENNELTVDEFGRVFNEGGEYVCDVVFEESQEIKDWKKENRE